MGWFNNWFGQWFTPWFGSGSSSTPTSTVARVRQNIKAIADGVTGFDSSRNVLGLDDKTATEDFFRDIVSDGLYLQVRPIVLKTVDTTTWIKRFSVECRVFFGIAGDADYTFAGIEDYQLAGITGLCDELMDLTNWTTMAPPQSISIGDTPELLTDKKPLIGCYKITLEFEGV